jgi:hypothetical protein
MLIFVNTTLYNCICDCCVFIVCRVFIVCVVLCAVFRLIVVLLCVICIACVLCLLLVPLPPGKTPFAVKINKNKYIWGGGGLNICGHYGLDELLAQ